MTERNDEIVRYFQEGLSYREISAVMLDNGMSISVRQIHRVLRSLDIRRRTYADIKTVIDFILNELEKSGSLHGYRTLRQRCLANGLQVRATDVRTIIQACDPEGVACRTAHRFVRRSYFAAGPNFIWHIDGYDKLKPYGLCIHGCICGYSRKVMWLNVYTTNNDPKVIGGYFLETVEKHDGTAYMIRGDFGTENVLVKDMQLWFRRNDNVNTPYIEGASTQNQRIECWWGYLRRQHIQYWMDIFKNLQDSGDFSASDIDKSIIQFCFMGLIQAELDLAVSMWNNHTIRRSRNSDAPHGQPNKMFNHPELLGRRNYICQVHQDDITSARAQVSFRTAVCCDPAIYDMCISVMVEDDRSYPTSANEALILYKQLRRRLTRML